MISTQFFPIEIPLSKTARDGMDEVFELLNTKKIDKFIGYNGICWAEKQDGREQIIFKIYKDNGSFPARPIAESENEKPKVRWNRTKIL